jgi:hypothetical protein
MLSAPVPNNVRYSSDSDRQPSRDRLTLCASVADIVLVGAPVSEGRIVDRCGNELRQGHHVTSQKSAYLRVARQMN